MVKWYKKAADLGDEYAQYSDIPNNVINEITYNGEIVDHIDITKLGSYIVNTYAIDSMGNKSVSIERVYNVVDTVAPLVKVNDMVLEKGHTFNYSNLVIYDNTEVSVERILALTPLPRPSERTTTVELSSGSTISIWSPQSCSP